eukprot:g43590.t1
MFSLLTSWGVQDIYRTQILANSEHLLPCIDATGLQHPCQRRVVCFYLGFSSNLFFWLNPLCGTQQQSFSQLRRDVINRFLKIHQFENKSSYCHSDLFILRLRDNEPEEERHDDPEQEEPENEGAMALLEAQQEAQDARDARVLQTDEKKTPDQAVAARQNYL